MSKFPGLSNYEINVPGTNVVAFLASFDATPERWVYSMWTGAGESEELLATGELDLTGLELAISPQQVGRIAFLMAFEHPSKEK